MHVNLTVLRYEIDKNTMLICKDEKKTAFPSQALSTQLSSTKSNNNFRYPVAQKNITNRLSLLEQMSSVNYRELQNKKQVNLKETYKKECKMYLKQSKIIVIVMMATSSDPFITTSKCHITNAYTSVTNQTVKPQRFQ